jgi:serine/threonine protein kinase
MSSIKTKVIDVLRSLEGFHNKSKDSNINKIFFKKYKVLKLICISKFNFLYEGINIQTKEKVAIKLEKINRYNFLEKEAYTLFSIKGFGIIDLISFGKNTKYNIMIQPLLGDSLNKLFLKNNKNFTLVDICLIGIQCLERIEWIHKNDIIHRDIKPDNFLSGIKDPRIIYLIDFGLCKKYRSKRTLKHIKYCYTKRIVGTATYNSVNSMKGYELSRRDDLESFFYMIIFFLMKKLPWQDIKEKTKVEKYKKILDLKCSFDINDYKILLPNEIINMFKYVKNLKFEEEPNYLMIKNSFKSILYRIDHNEDEVFSWINNKQVLKAKISKDKNFKKSSLKKRIYDRLTSSVTDFPTKNISVITETLTPLHTGTNTMYSFDPFKNTNNYLHTLPSKENTYKNYDLSETQENKTYLKKNVNEINDNRVAMFKMNILKNLITAKNNIVPNVDSGNVKNDFFYLKMNKNKMKNDNNFYKTYNNAENIQIIKNNFIENNNNNNLKNLQKYTLLNKNKNIINLNNNRIENKNPKILQHKINFRNINNNKNLFINNSNGTAQLNKNLLVKKNGLVKKIETKYIINNTFINNYNNKNIININNMKNNDNQGAHNNYYISSKNPKIERKKNDRNNNNNKVKI